MARAGPEDDAVFRGEIFHHLDAAIGLLVCQLIGDAVARLFACAEDRRRLQQERAIHDPQAAVARRPHLEGGQALLDLARLPDVADGGIHERLNARVGDRNAAVGQRRVFPIADRPLPRGARLP